MKYMLLLMTIALIALCWGYWSHHSEWRDAEKDRQDELWHATYYDNGKPRIRKIEKADPQNIITATQ